MVLTTYKDKHNEAVGKITGQSSASADGPISLRTTYRKLLADTLTPVSIYLALRDHFANSILLESSDYHSRKNSYSYICCEPLAGLELHQGKLRLSYPDGSTEEQILERSGEVSQILADFSSRFKAEEHDFEFITNGLFGYTSYEALQYFEDIELLNECDQIPEMHYQLYRYMLVFDHHRNELYLFENHPNESSPSGLDRLQALVEARDYGSYGFELTSEESSQLDDASYLEMVKQAKRHCERGDTFQLVLSRRFSQNFSGDEFNVYRALRAVNPSPYLFYFDYGNFKIFGSSPEAQLTIRDSKATIHPIAGTYRRTGDSLEDARLAKVLKEDDKENSEHVMLVDLARNDLARFGKNVAVESFREVQYFSHVIHLVSRVTALVDSADRFNLVGASFPAGTLTGAPKYKAMQLIDRYEPHGRGFYGGAIGFIGLNGDYNHAILIRSFLSKGNQLIYQAGAGIVADSIPEAELQEVYNKTDALRQAIKNATQL